MAAIISSYNPESVLSSSFNHMNPTSRLQAPRISDSNQKLQNQKEDDDRGLVQRRTRRFVFFANGDRYFRGKKISIAPHRYQNLADLMNDLTSRMPEYVHLPHGVRQLFTPTSGRRITNIEQLTQNGAESFVCAGNEPFKRVPYRNHQPEPWLKEMRRPPMNASNAFFSGDGGSSLFNRSGRYQPLGSVHITTNSSSQFSNFSQFPRPSPRFLPAGRYNPVLRQGPSVLSSRAPGFTQDQGLSNLSPLNKQVRPKVITVVRNGVKPRSVVKILLNRRGIQSFQRLMIDINDGFGSKWRTNRLKSLYTLSGKEVHSVSDFFRDDDAFIAVGSENIRPSDVRDLMEELYPQDPNIDYFVKEWERRADQSTTDNGLMVSNARQSRKYERLRQQQETRATIKTTTIQEVEEGNEISTKGEEQEEKRDSGFDESVRSKSNDLSVTETGAAKRKREHRSTDRKPAENRYNQLPFAPIRSYSPEFASTNQNDSDTAGGFLAGVAEREKARRSVHRDLYKERKLIEEERKKRGQAVSYLKNTAYNIDPFKKMDEEREKDRKERLRQKFDAERKYQEKVRALKYPSDDMSEKENLPDVSSPERKVFKDESVQEPFQEEPPKQRRSSKGKVPRRPSRKSIHESNSNFKKTAYPVDKSHKKSEKVHVEKEYETLSERDEFGQKLKAEEKTEQESKPVLQDIVTDAESKPVSQDNKEKETPKKDTAQSSEEKQNDSHKPVPENSQKVQEDDNQKESSPAKKSPVQNVKLPDSQKSKDDLDKNDQEKLTSPSKQLPRKQMVVNQDKKLTGKRTLKIARQVNSLQDVTEKYALGKMLGEGNFAVVRQCNKKDNNHEYAIKIIDKKALRGKDYMLVNEICIQIACKHPNIVRLKEVYESQNEVYVIMDLIKGGDLFDAITQSVKFNEKQASSMVSNIANALFYLHSRKIVHRDVKPENLMVVRHKDQPLFIKLADFGLAMEVKHDIYQVCGTPTYVAPEILEEKGYGIEVDMWALGVITYILLCGFPPFRSSTRSQTELFQLIKSGEFEFLQPYWDNISASVKDLIRCLLVVDRKRRFTTIDTLSHPWILTQGGTIVLENTLGEARIFRSKELEKQAEKEHDDYQRYKANQNSHSFHNPDDSTTGRG